MKTEFTKSDIAEETGLSIRTIQYYTDLGIIHPISGEGGHGRGFHRKYSSINLEEFRILMDLSRAGLKLNCIQKYFDRYRNDIKGLRKKAIFLRSVMLLIEIGQF